MFRLLFLVTVLLASVVASAQDTIVEPPIRWSLPLHSSVYTRLAVSPDGQLLVTTSYDQTVRVWHLPTRTLLYVLDLETQVYGASFSPDGQWIALSQQYGYVSLVNSSTGWVAWRRLGVAPSAISAFSRDGNVLYVARNGGSYDAYNLSGVRLYSTQVVATFNMNCLAVNPKGDLLALGGTGAANDVKVYLRLTRNGNAKATLSGLKSTVTGLGFSPDGKTLYGADYVGNIRKWNIPTNDTVGTAVAFVPNVNTYDMSISPDGTQAIFPASDGSVRMVKLGLTNTWDTIDLGYRSYSTSFSADGKSFFADGDSHSVSIFDAATQASKGILGQPAHVPISVAWKPGGSQLTYGDYVGNVESVDANLGSNSLIEFIGNQVKAVAYSSSTSLLAAGNNAAQIHVYDQSTKTWLQKITHAGLGGINALVFSPNGNTLASGSTDNGVWVWGMTSGDYGSLKHDALAMPNDVTALCYSSNGAVIASGDYSGNVYFWNASTFGQNTAVDALGAPITDTAYFKNPAGGGDKYFGVSFSNKVRLYEPPATSPPVFINDYPLPAGDAGIVVGFDFTPDGKQLAVASSTGTVYFLPIAGGVRYRTVDYGTLYGLAVSPSGDSIAVLTETGVKVVGSPTRPWLGSVMPYSYGETGGYYLTVLVRLTAPAPSAGVTVKLSVNNASFAVPASVFVPSGYDFAEVPVLVSPVAKATTGLVQATYGGTKLSVPVYILPPYVSSVTFTATTVVGGNDATCTVRLTGPAPAGGMAVKLKSSTNITLPSPTVTIPAGATFASFVIPTTVVVKAANASVTATTLSVQKSATFRITP